MRPMGQLAYVVAICLDKEKLFWTFSLIPCCALVLILINESQMLQKVQTWNTHDAKQRVVDLLYSDKDGTACFFHYSFTAHILLPAIKPLVVK